MGSLCSKHNTHSGSQQILGGETAAGRRDYGSSTDARAAAAAAAERRLKSGQARGTRSGTPKAGRLATQREPSKSTRMVSTSTREEEPLVWD
ncbi:hypothetical protein BKA83DRAFT_4205741 [Pisolithus microcarpus]|nr:hypothetical protein BKA83DRAFT_4205741 [Pisolithus microcarpus]